MKGKISHKRHKKEQPKTFEVPFCFVADFLAP